MQKLLLYTFFILLVSFLSIGASFGADWFVVKRVNDGDTVVLEDGRQVRYIGINAPEIAHADQKAELYGNVAKEFNENLVLLKKIRLEFDEERYDHYGRLLAYVYFQEGTFVNKTILEQGYAYCLHQKPNIKHDDVFIQAQRSAMLAGKGIWHNWHEKETEYLGNRNSKRFHLKTCHFGEKISKNNRIYFASQWHAFWTGFSPCKKCIGKIK